MAAPLRPGERRRRRTGSRGFSGGETLRDYPPLQVRTNVSINVTRQVETTARHKPLRSPIFSVCVCLFVCACERTCECERACAFVKWFTLGENLFTLLLIEGLV